MAGRRFIGGPPSQPVSNLPVMGEPVPKASIAALLRRMIRNGLRPADVQVALWAIECLDELARDEAEGMGSDARTA